MLEGTLKILFVRGKNLPADDGDTSDPYVKVTFDSFGKEVSAKSKVIKKNLNPQWNDL
jgi:Ca2+-dependent lipid-binding protein